MIARLFILLCILDVPLWISAQGREKISVNSGWEFVQGNQTEPGASWQKINLPHTWNVGDIVDDKPGYYQGAGWYRKEIFIPPAYNTKHLELFFEGACNRTEVFINGQKAGEHNGGFTGFRINLDNKAIAGQTNQLLVRVDNSRYLQDSIPPYSGDFNLMGGVYRDVWLIVTNKTHFESLSGNDGILFETPQVNTEKATYMIRAFLTKDDASFRGSLEYRLFYKDQLLRSGEIKLNKAIGSPVVINGELPMPRLWSPETPELYRLLVSLKNDKGGIIDEISQQVGFKWVAISRQNEFLLNGRPYKLKGASRHQDYKNAGNALTDDMHLHDITLMKEMGCNFIRIAHYPQDPAIYDACDRLGLIAWSEIPVVDKVVDNNTFFRNSEVMMQEMILQQYNHPSIAIWGYHNEVRNLEETTIRHAKMLDSIAKSLDKQRLTAMAFESNIEAPYFSNSLLSKILGIADINGYNVYQGWYRGRHENIGSFLDTLYAFNPGKPVLLSEYGAGSIINIHTYQPTLFDFSEEYQCAFHESYVKAGNTRPWMIGFSIWNFIDFQRDGREDVVPNINKKGMVTTDRQPKDVYYYYKSQWSKEPFIYIAGRHWLNRYMILDKPADTLVTEVVIYSNQPEIQLYCDGEAARLQSADKGKFIFDVPVHSGNNNFFCKTPDGKLADAINIRYTFVEAFSFSKNNSWNDLRFNTGQSRTYFIDPVSDAQWMPDKTYTKGNWGYVGGEIWNSWPSAAWNGIREGIHKPIANTLNEPLFQTFVQGLSAWKADLPAGKYRITLLLCEPFTAAQRKNEDRIFSISLNGEAWTGPLNIEQQYGVQTAVMLDKEVVIHDKEGMVIYFEAVKGKTILNGVAIHKL